ncbi:hypothetical protein F2P56_013329 [Juglans regia]|uniref:Uncharacterized protein n=1 Tax=Juglans regia TaxID=51240 RepID=A0A833XK56_JUGRE|nr:hypothetical protein F2P56_013329 [Juglans regia]
MDANCRHATAEIQSFCNETVLFHYKKRVHLAHNHFAGSTHTSLITLPKLLELRLEDNHFDGQIPDFQQESLNYFNVSGNELEGPIPNSFNGMDSSSFSGNLELCGKPMSNCDEGSIPSILVIVILATMAQSA